MQCNACNTPNDADACFCSECGKALGEGTQSGPAKTRKGYFFALLLIPVVALAVGIGYYKYFLPQGVAAVVNGEEIKRSELDVAVVNAPAGGGEVSAMLRHRVLNRMIAERLMLQEARKAGIAVPKEEVAAAVAEARMSSGLDEDSFHKEIVSQYGSVKQFESMLERRLLVRKFIAEKVAPVGADSAASDRAVSRWFEALSEKANVRIALAEQGAGAGCGCCGNRNETAGPQKSMPGCAAMATGAAAPQTTNQKQAAVDAGLSYWHTKHGPDAVTAKATDFGCHVQVDIIKDKKIIGSLRYQGGSIAE